MGPGNRKELNTWAEIAGYLGVSGRQAQYYEKFDGLPVHRMPGARRRVFAYTDEVDAWKRLLLAIPQGEDQQRVAPRPRFPRLAWVLSFVLLGAVVVALSRMGTVRRRPAAWEVHGNAFVAKDSRDERMWEYVFPKPIREGIARVPEPGNQHVVFGDIDDDGRVETIVGFGSIDYPAEYNRAYCFSDTGKVKWTFQVGGAGVFDTFGEHYSPPYAIDALGLVPDRKGRARVVVSANHYLRWPSQIVVLDGQGKPVGEYWHPGHLLYVNFADLDHDGKQEVLLAGVNNAARSAALVTFDPDRVGGAGNYGEYRKFRFRGLPAGTEKRIVLFPRSCVAMADSVPIPYNHVRQLRVTDDRIVVVVVESMADKDGKQIIYELDYELTVRAAFPSLAFRIAHHNLESSGAIKHRLDAGDLASKAVCVEGCPPPPSD